MFILAAFVKSWDDDISSDDNSSTLLLKLFTIVLHDFYVLE